jgi:predicted Rossmann fold nucleotide-binding protein DprA/Smf involved in DNA uptake
VVGSRNVGREAMEVASEVARLAVRERIPVVSGAARGIDQTAMAAALEAGGQVVGISCAGPGREGSRIRSR